MNENPLTLLIPGRFVSWYFRESHVLLTFPVNMHVNVVDACPGADALGDYLLIHFDDVLMMWMREQESNLLVGYSMATAIHLLPVNLG